MISRIATLIDEGEALMLIKLQLTIKGKINLPVSPQTIDLKTTRKYYSITISF